MKTTITEDGRTQISVPDHEGTIHAVKRPKGASPSPRERGSGARSDVGGTRAGRSRLKLWDKIIVAKKRVFLDECCGDEDLKRCFPVKSHVYVAADFGVRGKEDPTVIDRAIRRRCLIVTVNKDFVEYYRNHARRRGKKGTFFFGLIFLKPSKVMTRREQLQAALRDVAWNETRQHDDLIYVSAEGKTRHERLCHPECAAEFPAHQGEWA